MSKDRTPEALNRADVRRCGTLWVAESEAPNRAQRDVEGTHIRVVVANDVAALREAMIAARADNPALAAARLDGGRLGYLAEQTVAAGETRSGSVLAYGWIARAGDTVNDLGFPLELPAGEGWIYDCATIPAARGRGLYTALLRTMRSEFAAHGLERGWIGTEPRNWASQRGIARAAFQKVADMDWERDLATVYGAPGVPEAVLHVLANTMGEGGHTRVLPNAGIPWIEAILYSGNGSGDDSEAPAGLTRFRTTYGDQVHWSRAAQRPGEEPRVVIRCGMVERMAPLDAPFDVFARCLDELAPGLPELNDAPASA